MAPPRQRGIVPLVGKLPHQQAAELISLILNPTLTLARALDLALGPRPNRNPKQAAELLPHKTPSQIALLALCCKISSAARGRFVAPCGARYPSWGEARRKRLQVRRKSTKTRSSPRRFWNSRSRSSILNGAPVRQLAMLGSRLGVDWAAVAFAAASLFKRGVA